MSTAFSGFENLIEILHHFIKKNKLAWVTHGLISELIECIIPFLGLYYLSFYTIYYYFYSGYDEDNLCFPGSNNTLGCDGDTQESLSHYLYVFIIGAIILSFGSGPLYIVGVPAIEDTTTKDMAAWYLGKIHSVLI